MDAPNIPDNVRAQAEAARNTMKFPSISVMGCGGFGVNMVKKHVEANQMYDDEIKYSIVDTSRSNLSGISNKIEQFILAETGAGKIRSTHVDTIQQNLDSCGVLQRISDINVVIFSFSGGSGSVIGPLLVNEITSHPMNKAVILVGVIDDCSKMDCVNSINTLKSLRNLAKGKAYYPLMLYTNEAGRVTVNSSVLADIDAAIRVFTDRSVQELDLTDKLNFLNPINLGCTERDVFIVGFLTDELTENTSIAQNCGRQVIMSKNLKTHASLSVNSSGKSAAVMSDVAFVGVSDKSTYTALIGMPIPDTAVHALNKKYEKFTKVSQIHASVADESIQSGATHASGITL